MTETFIYKTKEYIEVADTAKDALTDVTNYRHVAEVFPYFQISLYIYDAGWLVDWDGYTIGYYGRIFEARNKTKGGSFEGDDKDFYKFKIGVQQVIPAFEEAVSGMALGGIRRIIVPPELGYPENDFNKRGPRPTTFSGQRALDFVLRNQGLIDKTLLFDIELVKIISN
ncbi:unnamed protein product [Ilex paraguariensis]|uniref:peptidylprolyl isomerase n=1 Tax=Ilex paraguariensis TaxID=185542 RepID=A0ABC8TBQ5_9AQUA